MIYKPGTAQSSSGRKVREGLFTLLRNRRVYEVRSTISQLPQGYDAKHH